MKKVINKMDDNNELLNNIELQYDCWQENHVQYLTVSKSYSRRLYMFFDWTEYSDKRSLWCNDTIYKAKKETQQIKHTLYMGSFTNVSWTICHSLSADS